MVLVFCGNHYLKSYHFKLYIPIIYFHYCHTQWKHWEQTVTNSLISQQYLIIIKKKHKSLTILIEPLFLKSYIGPKYFTSNLIDSFPIDRAHDIKL